MAALAECMFFVGGKYVSRREDVLVVRVLCTVVFGPTAEVKRMKNLVLSLCSTSEQGWGGLVVADKKRDVTDKVLDAWLTRHTGAEYVNNNNNHSLVMGL